jgi:hypothetical protein
MPRKYRKPQSHLKGEIMMFFKSSQSNSNNDNQVPGTSTTKYSFHFGINDYVGTHNDLRGCVNDAKEWEKLCKKQGFKTHTFTDRNATKENMKKALESLVEKSKVYGKNFHGILTFSGHGTHTADRNGDEPDRRDEALCMYDGLFIDDDLKNILDKYNPEAKMTFVSDCCHSGTITRQFLATVTDEEIYAKPRYLPPEDEVEASIQPLIERKMFSPQENMNEVLITGCKDTEYSYDAYFGGRHMGAMTYYATKILNENPSISYIDFYSQLRKRLPSNRYAQTPQLEGKEENRNQKFF